MSAQQAFGAWLEGEGTRFRLWAPQARTAEVVTYGAGGEKDSHAMDRQKNGCFTAWVRRASAGTRYKYRIDGNAEYPDPASRFQPEGVHGPSEVVDASSF